MNDERQTPEEIEKDISDLSANAALAIEKAKLKNVEVDIKQRFKAEMQYKVIRDVWHAILDDDWMYVVVWSEPRKGKTSCKMRIAYSVYHDWELVLDCIFFNLTDLIQKIDNNLPMRMWETKHHFHNRIPFLIGDDWGSAGNKAKIRNEPAWDLLKGAWDVFGTKIACIFVSMNQPDELTKQLANKYTHELWLPARGTAKYDKVGWNQNYYGWSPLQDKDWKQSFDFEEVPPDIYKRYDERRMSLVEDVTIAIKDKIIETDQGRIMKLLETPDYNLLEMVRKTGPISSYDIKKNDTQGRNLDAFKNCRSRSLLVPVRGPGGNYRYDLTDLAIKILHMKGFQDTDLKTIKRKIHEEDSET